MKHPASPADKAPACPRRRAHSGRRKSPPFGELFRRELSVCLRRRRKLPARLGAAHIKSTESIADRRSARRYDFIWRGCRPSKPPPNRFVDNLKAPRAFLPIQVMHAPGRKLRAEARLTAGLSAGDFRTCFGRGRNASRPDAGHGRKDRSDSRPQISRALWFPLRRPRLSQSDGSA